MESLKNKSFAKVINGDTCIRQITSDFIPYTEEFANGYYFCTMVRITRKGKVIVQEKVKIDAEMFESKVYSGDWNLIK